MQTTIPSPSKVLARYDLFRVLFAISSTLTLKNLNVLYFCAVIYLQKWVAKDEGVYVYPPRPGQHCGKFCGKHRLEKAGGKAFLILEGIPIPECVCVTYT